MQFSITTDLTGSKEDVAAIFPAFGAAGFTAVHWCQGWNDVPVFYDAAFAQRVKGLAAASGLRVADIHGYSGPPAGTTYTDELFLAANINRAEFAARVGADVLVLHLPLRPYEHESQAVAHSVDVAGRLIAACRPYGVKLAVENCSHTVSYLDAVLAALPPEDVGFCYDSGHALLNRHAEIVARYADRLLATHLHDNDGVSDQHRLPGEGRVDWPMVQAALKAAHYERPWNLEVYKRPEMSLEDFCRWAYRVIESVHRTACPLRLEGDKRGDRTSS